MSRSPAGASHPGGVPRAARLRRVAHDSCREGRGTPPTTDRLAGTRASKLLAGSADQLRCVRAPPRIYRATSARCANAAAGSPDRPDNALTRRALTRRGARRRHHAFRRGASPPAGNERNDRHHHGRSEETSLPMSSLQEHLDRHDRADPKLAFRRHCPVCRGERVLGQLQSTSLVSPRACAAVTALALVTSTAVPGTVLADGQGVAVPPPPSPPPPPANVQAAGGGAAPADADTSSMDGPAGGEHDNDAPARREGRPRDSAPASTPSAAGGTEVGDDVAGSVGLSPTSHVATGGGAAADDSPSASADRVSTASGSGEGATDSAPPGNSGDAVAPAPAATPAPAPAASAPTPAAAQVTTGPAATAARSRATPRPAGRPSTEHPHAAAAPVRPDASSPASSASGAEPRQGRAPDRRAASSGGAAPDRASSAAKPERAAAHASSSGSHRHVEIRTPSTYRVQPGDSLWRIAARHLGPDATTAKTAREVNRLWELNQQRIGTGNPDLIFPGQTLTM
jgi:resuscitation-promoting factor RpfA